VKGSSEAMELDSFFVDIVLINFICHNKNTILVAYINKFFKYSPLKALDQLGFLG